MRKVFHRSTAIAISGLAVLGLAVFVVATATAATKHKAATVDVCVLLPDTKSSVRWVQFDAPAFKAAFAKAGVKGSINNALNDPLKQKAQAQACIAAGASVAESVADTAVPSSLRPVNWNSFGPAAVAASQHRFPRSIP